MADKFYKRIFDSAEQLAWLQLHCPHRATVRRTVQDDAFAIEGKISDKVRIDEFVEKFALPE